VRVLVTGGAGFIGSNFVKLAERHRGISSVRVLDDFSTGLEANLRGTTVELISGSLLDPNALDAAVDGSQAVIHLAAVPSVPRSIKDPVASHAANATGTLLLLEACRRRHVDYIVGASSSSVYGMNTALPKHEREWVRPLSPYAVSKLATEQYLLAYQESYGFSSLAFRFFNVYGPGQQAGHAYAAVVPAFSEALLSGRPLPMQGDGTQSRDFTYVGTVCSVLLDAVLRRVSHPEPVNLAFGTRTDLNNLVHQLEIVTGRQAQLLRLPPRAGDVPHSQAENTSLRSLFPDVEAVPLIEGLAKTVQWFQEGLDLSVGRRD
jgi:UDP-glucose 4-epimerase